MKKALRKKEETRLKNLTKPFTISLGVAKELEDGLKNNAPTTEEFDKYTAAGLIAGLGTGQKEANAMLKYLATHQIEESGVDGQDLYNLDYWASVGLALEYTNSGLYSTSIKMAFIRMVLYIVGECLAQLQNEFESFTDDEIKMLKKMANNVLSSICCDFMNTINVDTIYNFIASQYGSIDADPNLDKDIETLAGAQCVMFSQNAIASIASLMFDAVYELCIGNGKCSQQDYVAIEDALKPIIFGAGDPLCKQALNFTNAAVYAFAQLDPSLIDKQTK